MLVDKQDHEPFGYLQKEDCGQSFFLKTIFAPFLLMGQLRPRAGTALLKSQYLNFQKDADMQKQWK